MMTPEQLEARGLERLRNRDVVGFIDLLAAAADYGGDEARRVLALAKTEAQATLRSEARVRVLRMVRQVEEGLSKETEA